MFSLLARNICLASTSGERITTVRYFTVHFLSRILTFGCVVPPIMLASFALQESSCNANPSGGDGHGLMQITTDKCGDAPGGNCEDPVSLNPLR